MYPSTQSYFYRKALTLLLCASVLFISACGSGPSANTSVDASSNDRSSHPSDEVNESGVSNPLQGSSLSIITVTYPSNSSLNNTSSQHSSHSSTASIASSSNTSTSNSSISKSSSSNSMDSSSLNSEKSSSSISTTDLDPISQAVPAIQKFIHNEHAFALLQEDGAVKTWGSTLYGGYSAHVDLSNIANIHALPFGFIAETFDEKIIFWGDALAYDRIRFKSELDKNIGNIQKIIQQGRIYLILTKNNQIISLSQIAFPIDSVSKATENYTLHSSKTKNNVIAKLKNVSYRELTESGLDQLEVVDIQSNLAGHLILHADRTISFWAFKEDKWQLDVKNLKDVASIASTQSGFAARLKNNQIHYWSNEETAIEDESTEDNSIKNSNTKTTSVINDVVSLHANQNTYAAITLEGEIITWTSEGLNQDISSNNLGNIETIIPTQKGFIAIDSDNIMAHWDDYCETKQHIEERSDSIAVITNGYAVVSINHKGELDTWGDVNRGGYKPDSTPETVTQSIELRPKLGCSTYGLRNSDQQIFFIGNNQPDATHIPRSDITQVISHNEGILAIDDNHNAYSWGINQEPEVKMFDGIKLVNTHITPNENLFSVLDENDQLTVWSKNGAHPAEAFSGINIQSLWLTDDASLALDKEKTLFYLDDQNQPIMLSPSIETIVSAKDGRFMLFNDNQQHMIWDSQTPMVEPKEKPIYSRINVDENAVAVPDPIPETIWNGHHRVNKGTVVSWSQEGWLSFWDPKNNYSTARDYSTRIENLLVTTSKRAHTDDKSTDSMLIWGTNAYAILLIYGKSFGALIDEEYAANIKKVIGFDIDEPEASDIFDQNMIGDFLILKKDGHVEHWHMRRSRGFSENNIRVLTRNALDITDTGRFARIDFMDGSSMIYGNGPSFQPVLLDDFQLNDQD